MSLGHKSVPQSLITTIEITKLRLSNCSVGNQIQNLRWPPNFGTPSKAWPKTFNQSYLFLLPPWDNFSDFSLLGMVWLRTSSLTFKGWFPYFVLFSAYKESTVLFCFLCCFQWRWCRLPFQNVILKSGRRGWIERKCQGLFTL